MASGSSQTLKTVVAMVDAAEETFESQNMLTTMVDTYVPSGSTMQDTGGVIWQNIDQHSPIKKKWDMTGEEEGVIKQQYPCLLTDEPYGNLIDLRMDDFRNETAVHDQLKAQIKRHISNQNKAIIDTCINQGSMYYDSAATDGLSFIGEAQKIMNQRQGINNGRNLILNDAETLTFATQLGNKSTMEGRPENDAWQNGMIGNQVAEFDIYTSSSLDVLTGAADPVATVNGNQSFKPESGTMSALNPVNVDYRTADIAVAAAAAGSYAVGDKIKFTNAGTDVFAVGLDDKTNTLEAMTFTVVAVPDANTLTIFPKPIAAVDAALSAGELAYANVNTTILTGAVIHRLNIADKRANIFFDKKAIKVLGGEVNAARMGDGGKKVIKIPTPNGLPAYLMYDGDITKATFQWRFLYWWQVTMANPSNAGVAVL